MKIHGTQVDITEKLDGFDASAKREILALMDDDFQGWFDPDQVNQLLAATGYSMSELMLWLGNFAALYAHVPISGFRVGAVSLGDSGSLYYGCNLEFAGEALSFCTHGEQSAITNAKYHGETGVRALAISAAPCGYCRQFLYELRVGKDLDVYLTTGPTTLGQLLPEAFGPGELGNNCCLLDKQDHQLTFDSPTVDPVAQAALAAAEGCYAPYTLDYAGVALLGPDGQIYTGGCEENVAYNPSVSPMEAALVAFNFGGSLMTDIQQAALVESRPSKAGQLDASRAVLSSIAPSLSLEYYTATSSEVPNCLTYPLEFCFMEDNSPSNP